MLVVVASVAIVSSASCSDVGPSSRGSESSATPESSGPTIESLCAMVGAKADAADAAGSEGELDQLSADLLEAQRRFVEEAEQLVASGDAPEGLSDYAEGVRTIITLNERSIDGVDHRGQLKLALQAARNIVEMFEAKEAGGLPESCPPASGGEAYGFLFQAQANVVCFNLGTELNELGRLQATTDTREESAKLFDLARVLAISLAEGIERAIPPEVGDPQVERMGAAVHPTGDGTQADA